MSECGARGVRAAGAVESLQRIRRRYRTPGDYLTLSAGERDSKDAGGLSWELDAWASGVECSGDSEYAVSLSALPYWPRLLLVPRL